MENKNMIIIVVAIIAVIAIVGGIFLSGMFNETNTVTTPFNTTFMEGKFVGNVTLEDDKEEFMHSYEDKEHKIVYNISTIDNSSALMDIYELDGVTNPEQRSFNGNDWNIYFTQAVPENESNKTDANPMDIVICESQGEKEGYLIYMIIDGESDINASGKTFSVAYKEYVAPLLESLTLKEINDVPKINEQFGLTEDQFAEQMDLVFQIKAGNLTALEG